MNKQTSHLGSATSHCLTSDYNVHSGFMPHNLWVITYDSLFESCKWNEFFALIYRLRPKLRKTKRISRFYKSDFDISPIETKIFENSNSSANQIQPQKQTFNTISNLTKATNKSLHNSIFLTVAQYLNHVVTHFRDCYFNVTLLSRFRKSRLVWDVQLMRRPGPIL